MTDKERQLAARLKQTRRGLDLWSEEHKLTTELGGAEAAEAAIRALQQEGAAAEAARQAQQAQPQPRAKGIGGLLDQALADIARGGRGTLPADLVVGPPQKGDKR